MPFRISHPDQLAIIVRHHPLSKHPHAAAAARGAICADRQQRFEAYHDLLFAKQDSLGVLAWVELADRAGVEDIAGFQACLGSSQTDEVLWADARAATSLDISVTPSFLLNGKIYRGLPPQQFVQDAIMDAINDI